jgi:hypothetical protein
VAIPVNATLTTVTETYIGQDGTSTGIPASGTIVFKPSNSIYVNDPGNAIFPPSTVTKALDAGGTFTAQLIAADDTDLSPTGWTYDVTENLSIGSTALPPRTYSIAVPSTGPVRLSAIAPTPPSGGTVTGLVTQVNGKNPDISGHVTLVPSDIGAYVKPGPGIPSTDLTTAVQTSLSSANTAVQPSRTITSGAGLTGGGDLSADRTLAVSYGTTSGTAAQGNDSRITGAEQVANKNATSGYAGLDSASRVAPANAPLVPQVQAPAFASTVTIDASTGSEFDITLTGNLTLGNPTNPVHGQKVLFALTQDATGSRTLTLGSAFNAGPLTVTLSTAANKVDYLLVKYRSAASKWDVLAFGAGY